MTRCVSGAFAARFLSGAFAARCVSGAFEARSVWRLLGCVILSFLLDGKGAEAQAQSGFVGVWQPDPNCVPSENCCCFTTRLLIRQEQASSSGQSGVWTSSLLFDGLRQCRSSTATTSQILSGWTLTNSSYAINDLTSWGFSASVFLVDPWHLVLSSVDSSSCLNVLTKDGFELYMLLSSSSGMGIYGNSTNSSSTASSTGSTDLSFLSSSSSSGVASAPPLPLAGFYKWNAQCQPQSNCPCGKGVWSFDPNKMVVNGSLYGGWGSTSALVVTTAFSKLVYAWNNASQNWAILTMGTLKLRVQSHSSAVETSAVGTSAVGMWKRVVLLQSDESISNCQSEAVSTLTSYASGPVANLFFFIFSMSFCFLAFHF